MTGQRGSLLPLAAGLLALALTLLFGIVSVTSLTIERHRLMALAESTALAASESFDPGDLRMGAGELIVPLTDGGVRERARDFLQGIPHRHEDLRVLAADTPDGRRARVILRSTWSAPLVTEFVPLRVDVTVEAFSRAIIR